MKITASPSAALGAFLLLLASPALLAATVTLTSLNATTLAPQSIFAPGDAIILDVSGSGFPGTGDAAGRMGVLGASLKLSFDSSKLAIAQPAADAGFLFAAGSPFGYNVYNGPPLFGSCGYPISTCNDNYPGTPGGYVGDIVSVLAPLTGPLPFGSFDAFRIRLLSTAAASGTTTISIFDAQNDFLEWFDQATSIPSLSPITRRQSVLRLWLNPGHCSSWQSA